MGRVRVSVVVGLTCVWATVASAQTPTPLPAPAAGLHRWLDVQTLLASARYRHIETSTGVVTSNQLQHSAVLKARFTFDAQGRFAVVAGAATGATFIGGWNNSGIGTPSDLMLRTFLKQLYVSAAPTRGVEAQFGGLYVLRGESTEITSYDNDAFITGERLTIKRPDVLRLDELSATVGYLGDTSTPNVLRRLSRLSDTNYAHVLATKRLGNAVNVSADLTRVSDVSTWRSAVAVRAPKSTGLDLVRLEAYRRVDHPASGYSAFVEKKLGSRVTGGLGVANVDLNNGSLNADRFGKGQRWFLNGSVQILPELAALTFYQHAFNNDAPLTNRSRLEFLVQFNALKALQRAKWY